MIKEATLWCVANNQHKVEKEIFFIAQKKEKNVTIFAFKSFITIWMHPKRITCMQPNLRFPFMGCTCCSDLTKISALCVFFNWCSKDAKFILYIRTTATWETILKEIKITEEKKCLIYTFVLGKRGTSLNSLWF